MPQSHNTLQERQAASQRAMPVVPSMYGPVGASRGGYTPAEHSFYHGESALYSLKEQLSGPSPLRLNCPGLYSLAFYLWTSCGGSATTCLLLTACRDSLLMYLRRIAQQQLCLCVARHPAIV